MVTDFSVQIDAIGKAGIPSVLVSSKCDTLQGERKIDPAEVEQKAKRSVKNLNTLQTSIRDSETHKRGLSIMLRDILSQTAGKL